jgi:hypothetical protein
MQNLKGTENVGELITAEMIILKWILQNQTVRL